MPPVVARALRDYAFRNSGGDKYFFGQPGSDVADRLRPPVTHLKEGRWSTTTATSSYNSVNKASTAHAARAHRGLSDGDEGYEAAQANCAQLGPQSKNRDDNRTVCSRTRSASTQTAPAFSSVGQTGLRTGRS